MHPRSIWRVLRSLVVTMMVTGCVLVSKLMSFFIKDVLWVPANHFLNFARLVVLIPVAAVVVRESHDYANDE